MIYWCKTPEKNHLNNWVKCPQILFNVLLRSEICFDTLDMILSPEWSILDIYAFKRDKLNDFERQIVLLVLDKKKEKFVTSLWGFNFIKSAKSVNSPNIEFFEMAIKTLYRPRHLIVPCLKWNSRLDKKIKDHVLETILNFLIDMQVKDGLPTL